MQAHRARRVAPRSAKRGRLIAGCLMSIGLGLTSIFARDLILLVWQPASYNQEARLTCVVMSMWQDPAGGWRTAEGYSVTPSDVLPVDSSLPFYDVGVVVRKTGRFRDGLIFRAHEFRTTVELDKRPGGEPNRRGSPDVEITDLSVAQQRALRNGVLDQNPGMGSYLPAVAASKPLAWVARSVIPDAPLFTVLRRSSAVWIGFAVVLAVMAWRVRSGHPDGCCAVCGYDLKGLDRSTKKPCPECGEPPANRGAP